MSKILVTGGSGFIGTNLVEFCLKRGDEVLNLDVATPRNPALADTARKLNILDASRLNEAVRGFNPEYIFHLAARTDLDGRSIEDYEVNTTGVKNLIEAASFAPCAKRVVFASSMYVCKLGYTPKHDSDYFPHTAYGESKVLGEKIVREHAGNRFTWVIVRPTSIWGPWFDVPYKGFFTTVKKGLYFHPRGHRVKRSYGFVLNIVSQLIGLMFSNLEGQQAQGKVFYLADYQPVDVKQWADTIAVAFGKSKTHEAPLFLLRVVAAAGDMLKRVGVRNPPLTSSRLNNLLTNAVFDMQPVQALCGEAPFTIEAGVRMTVEWMNRFELSRMKVLPAGGTLQS